METKECTKCHKTKPLNEFVKSTTTKTGRRSVCTICTNSYRRIHNQTHPSIRTEEQKDKHNLSVKKYKSNNKEKVKLARKTYNETHKEIIIKHHKYHNPRRNKQIVNVRTNALSKKHKDEWIDILNKLNYITCRICGFNEDFCAIDLHHVNGNKEKIRPSKYLRRKYTQEKIDYILKSTVSLCSNCHRMVHHSEKYKDYKF